MQGVQARCVGKQNPICPAEKNQRALTGVLILDGTDDGEVLLP